jgi:hypothetical protein
MSCSQTSIYKIKHGIVVHVVPKTFLTKGQHWHCSKPRVIFQASLINIVTFFECDRRRGIGLSTGFIAPYNGTHKYNITESLRTPSVLQFKTECITTTLQSPYPPQPLFWHPSPTLSWLLPNSNLQSVTLTVISNLYSELGLSDYSEDSPNSDLSLNSTELNWTLVRGI